jgi:hypothetical protein
VNPNVVLPLTSSLLSFVFAGLVFEQWRQRHKRYQFVWTLGMLWYALSAGTEFLGGAFGWNPTLYRWWYLIGAIGVACYLGLGTVYLHARDSFGGLVLGALILGSLPAVFSGSLLWGLGGLGSAVLLAFLRWQRPARFADAFFALAVLGTLVAAVVIFLAPVDAGLLPRGPDEIVSGKAFPAYVRIITPLFNITGAFSLAFGAVYSAVYFWRTHTRPNRLVSNVFIAVGAFIPGLTSGLSRFGVTEPFFIGELLGVVCIFIGFLISVEVFATIRRPSLSDIIGMRRRLPAAR